MVVQVSSTSVNATTERRTVLSIVGLEVSGEVLRSWRRLRERRPKVPVCLARNPERILCFEESARVL